ncbi:hypothetical protein NC981_13920 [Leptolyngbya sp. DQ-M1]|uniref:hypothetical protein n=1 Tax=Leptolyngbya sp. DQ-M1 TaxID=2933920 RepID=UPI0032974EEF
MSKPRFYQSSSLRRTWRLVNLILLTIGFVIPVVQDQEFGMINYLHILFVLVLFLPGVIFQAIAIPGKLPGLLLYAGGLVSLVSLLVYLLLGIMTFGLQSSSVLKESRRRNLQSLLLITLSGIGVFAILFLWQEHLAHGAAIMVVGLISCWILEWLELQSAKLRQKR